MAKQTEGLQYTANKFRVIRGEDVNLIIHAVTNQSQAMSLMGIDNIETKLPKEGGGTLTLGNALHSIACVDPGLIILKLNNENSSQLKVGENQVIQVTVSFTAYGVTNKRIIQIADALTVIKGASET